MVAFATAHNRECQTQREAIYTIALDVTLFHHEFEFDLTKLPVWKEVDDNTGNTNCERLFLKNSTILKAQSAVKAYTEEVAATPTL